MKKALVSGLLAAALAAGMLAGCSGGSASSGSSEASSTAASASGSVTADGSTALQPLLLKAAPLFKTKTGFSGAVNIGGGGSGQGLSDVESGAVLIGNSDVTVAQAGKSYTDLVDHPVCVVAVAIVVSPDVAQHFGSNGISIGDIQKIYAGTVTNWKNVKGSGNYDKPIAVCYRKKGSGTRTLFETFGTGVKFDENASYVKNGDAFTYTNASADLQTKISSAEGAVGYETLPYAKDMKRLSVDFGSGAAACSYNNVNTGKYKIWGYEHLYTKGEAAGAAKDFITFVTSKDFESTITDNGYGLSSAVGGEAAASHK